MELRERPSGLVEVFDKPPEPHKPRRYYRAHEIKDDEVRTRVRKAMVDLWRASELIRGQRGILGVNENWETHAAAWRYLGEMFLGDECPECEVYT